jgi:hypothetical protein
VLAALRHRSRCLAWVAFLAIFALVLVPTVSRALSAAQGGSGWAEVCTPQGTKVVALDAAGRASTSQPAGGATPHLDHCPLCGLGGGAVLPPPVSTFRPAFARLAQWRPPLFFGAPRPLFAWSAAQPRAPPYSS